MMQERWTRLLYDEHVDILPQSSCSRKAATLETNEQTVYDKHASRPGTARIVQKFLDQVMVELTLH